MKARGDSAELGAFGQRYMVERYGSGGVVIDLDSGNYYRINRTAALVCEALVHGPNRAEAAASVAAALRIDVGEATSLVKEVVAGLDISGLRGEIQGSYHFYLAQNGYELRHGRDPVLELSADGASVQVPAGSSAAPLSQMELYVRALAPKVLFQNRITVLHASSCLGDDKLIAFAGVSGAGKTTTARAFSAAGSTLVSEDLVVFSPEGSNASVVTNAEKRIHEWATAVACQLVARPNRPAATNTLVADALRGPTIPLRTILFVDHSRREGTEFRSDPMEEPDALAELLRHDFLGAEAPTWRRFFQSAVTLLRQLEARRLWAPDGTGSLAAAASRYISRTAS